MVLHIVVDFVSAMDCSPILCVSCRDLGRLWVLPPGHLCMARLDMSRKRYCLTHGHFHHQLPFHRMEDSPGVRVRLDCDNAGAMDDLPSSEQSYQ